MKLAISGSRDFSDLDFMIKCLESVFTALGGQATVAEIWSGGAKGADALAKEAATHFGTAFHEIKADWAKFGHAAGPKRNAQLVAECDVLAAFPIGQSKGTRGCIELARKAGRQLFIFES